MKRVLQLAICIWFCCIPTALRAESNIPFITTDELKTIYDAKADFLLINALSPIEFAEESISGSVNIPYNGLKSGKVKLPQNKGKKLVFYCKGPK
jgi:rhodanese-related sulfurtransferase